MQRKGKGIYRRIISAIMVMMMVFSMTPATIFAAASMTTEDIDTPEEATVHAEVYFTSKATNKIITLNGTVNDPIDCADDYSEGNIPANGLFKVYYGKGTTDVSKDKTVVNFTSDAVNTSWKADNDKVFQMTKRTNPSGWESVTIEPQGDGTVAFKSNANGKYFTLKDSQLQLVTLNAGEKTSSNEKFVMHTTTAPKTAKKVTLSGIQGGSIKVNWQGVDECLYCGYQVMYATSEDGEYKVAGETADTSFEITGLTKSTRYYVKVRTVTNDLDGAYADSQIAYADTLAEYRPGTPENITVEEKNGKIILNWDAADNATNYKVYRAVSRYADYTEIASGITDTTYTDENPNTTSKYANYYRIAACNSADQGKLSEAGSIEINMFGTNAYIFAPTDNQSEIDSLEAKIFEEQHYNQFGKSRYALMYKPGDYTSTKESINSGYYTQILGLGKTPYDVVLPNVKTPAALSGNNVTCNFWQGIENVTIKDLDNNGDDYYSFQWAVSQAAPARRMNVERKAVFDWWNGWASGGYFADSYFHKKAGSYSQQQYYYRNCQLDEGTFGINWNQVIQGCTGLTADNTKDNTAGIAGAASLLGDDGITNWAQRGCITIVEKSPVIREKSFLYFDTDADEYRVFIPALRKDAQGITWSEDNMGEGTSVSVEKYFYIANPDKDTAETINKQLKAGKNILFQPGIYHVTEPIRVTRANTVLLGIGMATIIPDNEESAIIIDDVGGVSVDGIVLDAGRHSETLLRVGEEGCNKDHSDNPIVLHDVIYRVGGTGDLGTCDICQVINSNDVIIDQTWIWRADHGDNTGWYANTAKNGLVVNGDNVIAYGLFCEHFQEYDVIWRGENGRTYFLQNEKCYDPQNQDEWMSHNGTVKGYAAYKVANNVTKHYAVGLGIYDVFINTNGASIFNENAIEMPDVPGVLIENACTVEISNGSGPAVGTNNIVNNTAPGIRTGNGTGGGYAVQRLLSYEDGKSVFLADVYTSGNSTEQQEEEGISPENDPLSEKDIVKEALSKDDEKPLWEMTDADFAQKLTEIPDDNPIVDPGDNPVIDDPKQDEPASEEVVKKGDKFTVGKYTYKVTKVSKKTGNVTLTGVVKKYRKTLKKATVKKTVKYKGYKFNVTVVGKKAFKKCKKLTKVTVGKNVTKIKKKAFAASKKLKTFKVKGTKLKKIAKTAFNKKVRKTLKVKAKKAVKKKVLKSLKRTK